METKPHPRPLSEERGEWLAMEMEEVILGLIGGGDSVDNKKRNELMQMAV